MLSRDFSELPPELQLQFMEEDMASDEVIPDEQQLEVLEDIWLKAGEIGKFLSYYCYLSINSVQM